MGAASRRARETTDKAGELAQDAARAVEDVSSASLEFAKGTTQDFLQGSATIAGQLRNLPSDAIDRLFTECPVPMFILPVSPDPDEYCIVFKFDEVFDSLQAGIFVRPKIEAWAVRDSGWQMEHLAEELKGAFTAQFEHRQVESLKPGDKSIAKLESKVQNQSQKMNEKLSDAGRSLVKAPIEATLGGLLLNPLTGVFTWPLGLLYLGLALYNGHKAISLPMEYLELRSQRNQTQRERKLLVEKQAELEEQFDGKNETFQQAVGNIQMRVHPQLQELYRLICDKDGVLPHSSAAGLSRDRFSERTPFLGKP